MALIVGSIIGVGIFNLPTSLAAYGPITLMSMALTTVGALALALLFASLAQLKWRWVDHETMQTPRFARDMIVAVLSLVFSILFIWYSRNTGHSFWVYWAPFFLAAGAPVLGIPVYLGQRRHMAQPASVPPYR
jgi:basic amino acid/polyamine antiporter, APA family